MRTTRNRGARLGVLAAVATLVLSACGGGSIDDETKANEDAAGDAGDRKSTRLNSSHQI